VINSTRPSVRKVSSNAAVMAVIARVVVKKAKRSSAWRALRGVSQGQKNLAGVLTRVLAHRTERDPESRESCYLPSFVNLQALLSRLSSICLSRMESAVSGATFSFFSLRRRRCVRRA
jgi:hypothetical protein